MFSSLTCMSSKALKTLPHSIAIKKHLKLSNCGVKRISDCTLNLTAFELGQLSFTPRGLLPTIFSMDGWTAHYIVNAAAQKPSWAEQPEKKWPFQRHSKSGQPTPVEQTSVHRWFNRPVVERIERLQLKR